MLRYDMYDLFNSNRMTGTKGIHTGYVTRYLEMEIYSISNGKVTGYVTDTGNLLEIQYKGYGIFPWGEVHKIGSPAKYNGLYNTEFYTLDDLLDMIDENMI